MAILPTVKLQHKRTGQKLIINQTDYGENLGKWQDWKIISMRRGDASDAEVVEAAAQQELERQRAANPKAAAYSDAARKYLAHKINTPVTTGSEEEPGDVPVPALETPQVALEQPALPEPDLTPSEVEAAPRRPRGRPRKIAASQDE